MANEKYQLTKLLEGLDMVSSDCSVYMNKQTGDFITITDESLRTYEEYESGVQVSLLEWEKDMVQEIDEVLSTHQDEYVQLPSSYEIHEHKIMENFCNTLEDNIRREFLNAIFHKGAFQRFHRLLIAYNLRNKWFEYKRNAYLEKLMMWCDQQGFDYE